MSNSSELITVGDFQNVTEAYVAMGALRNEGIECQVIDGNASLYTPIPAPAGGAKLLVFKRDLDCVMEILGRND